MRCMESVTERSRSHRALIRFLTYRATRGATAVNEHAIAAGNVHYNRDVINDVTTSLTAVPGCCGYF